MRSDAAGPTARASLRTSVRTASLPVRHPCAGCAIRLETFCGVLAPDELHRFRASGSTGRADAGTCLFHEGDSADRVFNITRGTLKLYKLLPDGRRQVAGFAYPGDILGITTHEEHAFTAETLEPCEYCRFARDRFLCFVDEHQEVGRELFLLAAHELAAAREHMVVLGRKRAPERVASFLLGLFDRVRAQNADWEIVRLPMTRTDIADYLGLTKETVSRTFTRLRKAGLIALLPADRVELLQRKELEQLACAMPRDQPHFE
jgi:CRP/FNR family transcriptional regulator, anaerobic regulatory protein